ncbi:MAG: MBL fold metallo-hydrolase [Solirubrobacteraceae bacterium]|jgi:glyoxylase-like metal-dependent hydrolase (beta-lactamase superfamily II)
MRAVGVHEDVIVIESRLWRTTCTALRSGTEGFVIDSPVLPDELELLGTLLEQAQFPFSGLLATHGDFDHLLGRLAFPGASLGVAETTAARLRAEPGAPQRALRDFDERFYIARPAPLALGSLEALAVPGYCGIGEREIELHPADGHTVDGMAIWVEWASVLICGDYLSPVEIPTPEASLDGYLATLARLEPLAAQARHVVPGHGGVLDGEHALRILGEDRVYLEALREAGAGAPLPRGRSDREQRRLHAANVARLATAGGP